MNDQTRERFWLPIAIPVGALAFIGLVAFGMSRILLNVPSEIATAVALMAAFNVLVVCSLIALRKNLRASEMGVAGIIALVPLMIGGAVAAGVVEVKGGEEHEAVEHGPTVQVAADALKFDKAQLEVPADEAFELAFNNKDAGVPHNVAILQAQGSGEALVRTPLITGPKTSTTEVKPIPGGTYYFQCDVHPNMSGQVTAA